ncbi:MAG TPA: hypothetical protein V6D27_11170 [Vampirovibrionales bacterium]
MESGSPSARSSEPVPQNSLSNLFGAAIALLTLLLPLLAIATFSANRLPNLPSPPSYPLSGLRR